MTIDLAKTGDLPDWLRLAREVEPLFGPMADSPEFLAALQEAVRSCSALCARDDTSFCGAVAFDRKANEIAWLAVASGRRSKGCGAALLERAIAELDGSRPILVQTFAEGVPAGEPALRLYERFGFRYLRDGGPNPAGIATAFLQRDPR
jgi:GNAT superfamily N-acetyltransferase